MVSRVSIVARPLGFSEGDRFSFRSMDLDIGESGQSDLRHQRDYEYSYSRSEINTPEINRVLVQVV